MSEPPINPNNNLSDKIRYLSAQLGADIAAITEQLTDTFNIPPVSIATRLKDIAESAVLTSAALRDGSNPNVTLTMYASSILDNVDELEAILNESNTIGTISQDVLIQIRNAVNEIKNVLQQQQQGNQPFRPCTTPVLRSTGDRTVGRFGFDGNVTLELGREATFTGASTPGWLSLSAEGIGAPLNRVTVSGEPAADAYFYVATDYARVILVDHAAGTLPDVRDIAPNTPFRPRTGARYSFEIAAGNIIGARQLPPITGFLNPAESLIVMFCGDGTPLPLNVASNQTTVNYDFGGAGGSRMALFPTSQLQRSFVTAFGQAELPGFVIPPGYTNVVFQNIGSDPVSWARFRGSSNLAGGTVQPQGQSPNFASVPGDVVLIWRAGAPPDDYFSFGSVVVQANFIQ